MVGYEQVEPLTLVWSIRPGMKFHNGDPVDSEAVAFSFGRLAKLYEVTGYSHVDRKGFDFVDSFEATDELTMTEHWRRPNADALAHRARSYYSFLNPGMVEAQGVLEGTYTAADGTTEDVYSVQDLPFGTGSGPYVVAKRDETGTRVERWPGYHRHVPADDGFVEGGPYIDAWETRVVDYSYGDAKEAFLRGELDVYGQVFREELADFEEVDHVAVVEMQNGGYSHLGMDGLKFHDKRARQALQKAIDYEGFIEAVRPHGGHYAGPISNLLPHAQRLSQQDLRQWQRYEPEESRALWAAADFVVPIDSIKTLAGPSPVVWQIGEFVSQSLGETLGLGTDLWDTDSHCRSWSGCPPLSGRPDDLEAVVLGTGEAGGTTGVLQDSLVHYDPQGYGQRLNHSHLIESPHPDVEADALTLTAMLEGQEQEMDFDTRVELLTDVQRWILDNAWCVLQLPLSRVQHFAFSSRLRDYAPDEWATPYALRRESMWLAPA
ncbi:MAG: ABC transporter substrate-binding protein [Chloroflexi bacterium]|nr:ABC transporter substrate-binding protein [Chloroflexota bacterium]